MHKLRASVHKEILLLKRDSGALIILFVMPMILIVTITLIQDSSFKTISESKLPILLVDLDKGKVGESVQKNLEDSKFFEVITSVNDRKISEAYAKERVFAGEYQLAIIIPERLSSDLQIKIEQNVAKVLADAGLEDRPSKVVPDIRIGTKEIKLYFDPATQTSFKNAVKNNIDKMISELENKSIYSAFQDQLGEGAADFQQESFIAFTEILPEIDNKQIIPDATQHNVPAWTLFAIFFIVIPLSINLVKEKNQGTLVRLRTLPMDYSVVIAGKTITFLLICMIQFYLMLLVGIYLFPLLGLPPLVIHGKLGLMSLIALCSGFAAIGFGILLGTVAKTQEQSAPFGATAVVILAAVGGVWVPVFAMPGFMQQIARLSPMNWGLNAFYDVILRHSGLGGILSELACLLAFFAVMVIISLVYDEKKRAV